MIFGRKKKMEKAQAPAAAEPAAVAKPVTPAPGNPTSATLPPVATPPAASVAAPAASPATVTAASPASPQVDRSAAAAPVTDEEKELRARRALGAKMVAASFGEIVSVLMRSGSYKHFSLSDLEWLVVPPVLTQQFVLAEARKGEDGISAPIAVALWASVSDEVDKKLMAMTSGPLKLRPDEWKSGEILWLIDAIGPQQVLTGMVDNLQKNVFKGRPLKVRSRDEDGKPIVKIHKLSVADGDAAT